MTFLCVTTQQRRSNQWLPLSKVSFEEILPGGPGAFLFTVQHLLSAAISPYKDQCKNQSMLTDMNVVDLNKKQVKEKRKVNYNIWISWKKRTSWQQSQIIFSVRI